MEKEVGRSDYFSPPPPQVQKDAHFFIAKLYLENGLNEFSGLKAPTKTTLHVL